MEYQPPTPPPPDTYLLFMAMGGGRESVLEECQPIAAFAKMLGNQRKPFESLIPVSTTTILKSIVMQWNSALTKVLLFIWWLSLSQDRAMTTSSRGFSKRMEDKTYQWLLARRVKQKRNCLSLQMLRTKEKIWLVLVHAACVIFKEICLATTGD